MSFNLFNISIELPPLSRYHLVIFLFCFVAPGLLSWQGYWYWSFSALSLGGIVAWVFHRWEQDDNRMLRVLANRSVESRWEWLIVISGLVFGFSTFGCLVGLLLSHTQLVQ